MFIHSELLIFALQYIVKISREDSPVLSEAGLNTMKPSETERQSDAMAVQRAFANTKKVMPHYN